MRISTRLPAVLLAALVLVFPLQAGAQVAKTAAAPTDPTPAIVFLAPPSATIGRTVEWTVSGRNLDRVERWTVSGTGVEVLEAPAGSGDAAKLKVKVDPTAEPGYREVRAVGPAGLSNLAVVRIDRLDGVAEVEPNDSPGLANEIHVGQSAWGILKPQDLDFYRFRGRAGQKLTIDLESQRIGTPLVPVVTILNASGVPLGRARETRGTDHDARFAFAVPADGEYRVEVRDDLYRGGDSASYRLRVEEAPFAVGLFPLGGPRGATITVTTSGGSLSEPRSKTITLPDTPGVLVDPGTFDGPGGPILAPMTLVVGDGLPEVLESSNDSPLDGSGVIVNGRLGQPGEVDRFRLVGKKGRAVAVRVRASDMGSWLDSVVTVRDASGAVVAENDDPGDSAPQRNPFAVNQATPPPDSRLVFEPKEDGELTIELADRYGDGGPAFAYRMEVGPNRPDFAISLLFSDPNAARRGVMAGVNTPPRPAGPGSTGVLNLRPGVKIPINFLLTIDGRTGPIEVRAEGLPDGVTATVQKVNPPVPPVGRNGMPGRPPSASGGSLVLSVAPDAQPVSGTLRIVATTQPPDGGRPLSRVASAAIAIDTPLPGNAGSRPVLRTISSIPIRVIGEAKSAPIASAETTPASIHPSLQLKEIRVPGVLFQGARMDLDLDLVASSADRRSPLLARVSGSGVSALPLWDEPPSADGPAAKVRLSASPNADPGVRTVTVTVSPRGRPPIEWQASVIVRPPVSVRVRDELLVLAPDATSRLVVAITREPGFDGPVRVEITPPPGVRVLGRTTIPTHETILEVELAGRVRDGSDSSVRVVAVATMTAGAVRAESTNRAKIAGPSAEKDD